MAQYDVVRLPYEFKKTLKETKELGKSLLQVEGNKKNCWVETAKDAAKYIHFCEEGLYYAVQSHTPRAEGMVYQIITRKEHGTFGQNIHTVYKYKQVLNEEDKKKISLMKKLSKLK